MAPKLKTPLQDAKAEYKAAIASLNVSKNKLDQSKESVFALDRKVKAMLITVCENTREYVNLKQVVTECKAKLDEIAVGQDAFIDQRLSDLANSHASAMNQLNQADSDDDYQLGSEQGNGDTDDLSNIYEKRHQQRDGASSGGSSRGGRGG